MGYSTLNIFINAEIYLTVIIVILYIVPNKQIFLFRRLNAIKSILKPTERFLWIKTNMILMLIWYGSGLAFRYTRPPNLENRQMSINGTIEEIVFSNMGAGWYLKIQVCTICVLKTFLFYDNFYRTAFCECITK